MARKLSKPVESDAVAEVVDRPFAPTILKRAKELAAKYRIVLEPDEDAGYLASALELPNVLADGPNPNAAVTAARDALAAAIAYLIESGQTPPLPAAEQIRDRQINIRLTETEQRLLKEAAKAHNCSDMSEYVRSKVLA
jgi:predicted RNase H-like HicB family nuclease